MSDSAVPSEPPETPALTPGVAPGRPEGVREGGSTGEGVSDAHSGAERSSTWAQVQALAALLEPEAFDPDQAVDESWRRATQGRALAHATKVITSGYLKVEPGVRVFELDPDDVVLIGNVHGGLGAIRAFMDWAKDEWPGRKVVCFADDIDVQTLRDSEAEFRGGS